MAFLIGVFVVLFLVVLFRYVCNIRPSKIPKQRSESDIVPSLVTQKQKEEIDDLITVVLPTIRGDK